MDENEIVTAEGTEGAGKFMDGWEESDGSARGAGDGRQVAAPTDRLPVEHRVGAVINRPSDGSAGVAGDGREESYGSAGAAEAKREAEVREFMETFPEAAQDPRSIPPEVWAEVRNGRSLVAAYGRYSAAQVRMAREAAERQEAARRLNGENMARSAGSMRSAGEGNGARDPFLEGWEE